VRLMGKPEKVEAHMANHHLQGVIEVEDAVDAYMILDGKPALFYATTAYATNSPVLIELQLENAVLRMESDALEIHTKGNVEKRTFQLPETLGKGYWGNGHFTCIADFYHILATGEPYQNDIHSVEDTVNVMLQIYEQGKKDLA